MISDELFGNRASATRSHAFNKPTKRVENPPHSHTFNHRTGESIMPTAAQKNQIVELRAKGYSFEKISEQLHISKQTLIKKTREPEDVIVNLRKTEIEELQEKHFLNKRQWLQTYGDHAQEVTR